MKRKLIRKIRTMSDLEAMFWATILALLLTPFVFEILFVDPWWWLWR